MNNPTITDLSRFLLYCGREGYASVGDNGTTKESDGSTTILIKQGEFTFHDNYFGGEPYGGREVVFYQNKTVWMMVYYGLVLDLKADMKPVYGFLRKALAAVPDEAPFRGPNKLISGDLTYTNRWQGEVTRFSGEEFIAKGGQVIYQANYLGGFVDQA